jgi:hypothetical protein
MENDELERLELDLRAVANRLGGERSWAAMGPRVQRALRRPRRDLLTTLGLIAATAVAGFWATSAWLATVGLVLAVLPDRIRAERQRRSVLAGIGEGDLFALYRDELMRRHGSHFVQALVSTALGLLFALAAVLAPNPIPGLAVAALLVLRAAVSLGWLLPRAARELRDLERGGESD